MSVSAKVDLEQLLEVAISTPDVGNVNFNVLKGFLYQIIQHLGIKQKTVCINDESEDFKSVYDMFRDGLLSPTNHSPCELNLIDEQDVDADSVVKPQLSDTTSPNAQYASASRSDSRRTKSATPRMSKEMIASVNASDSSIAKSEGSRGSPNVTVTPPLSNRAPSSTFPSSIINPVMSVQKTSSRSSNSFYDNNSIRGELKMMKRNFLDLMSRVENLEKPRSPLTVRSTASMLLQGESKTPAQDMIEIINIGRRLDAFESTIQVLSEMTDNLRTELHDARKSSSKIDYISKDMENVKDVLKKLENKASLDADIQREKEEREKAEEREVLEKESDNKLEELGQELKDLIAHMNAYKREVERIMQHEINQLATSFMSSKDDSKEAAPFVISSEPPKECFEALDKCDELQEAQAVLEVQFKDVTARVENLESMKMTVQTETTSSGVNDFISQLRQELKALNNRINLASKETSQATKRLDFEHKQISARMEENKLQMSQIQSNLELKEKDMQSTSATLQALLSEKEDLKRHSIHRPRTNSVDASEDISLIRTMIFDLQEEKENLKHANKGVLEEVYQKQKFLDELHQQLERMDLLKADKDLVTNEIKFKADKRDVELKVAREDFDRYIGLVDQSLRDLLQRLERHENILGEAINSISGHIKNKLDKTEVEPLKHYFEERLKAFKPKPVEIRPPAEEYAAGFRKVLIKNFSCISCDRPVEYARDVMFPPLPSTQPMPIKKSNRPYTTYELDQVRQHMLRGGLEIEQERFEAIDYRRKRLQSELLKLNGVPNVEELAEVIDRPCGGSHTLSFPHSRSIIRGLQLNKEDILVESEEKNVKNLQNVDIMGQDGHIYKGLVEDVPVVLPQINDKPVSPSSINQRNDQDRCRSNTPTSAMKEPKSIDDIDSS